MKPAIMSEETKRILVVGGGDEAFARISATFTDYKVEAAATLTDGLGRSYPTSCQAVFLDVPLLAGGLASSDLASYEEALGFVGEAFPGAQIVAMAPADRMRDLVMVVKAGAVDYLTYPVLDDEMAHVRECLERVVLPPAEPEETSEGFWNVDVLEIVQTRCEAMKTVLNKIRQVAETRSTVLLTGETGTGKNLMARIMHEHSNRRDKPYVTVHCGAIPDTLVESELFGYERGAFTGASKRKLGRFEVANGGTIFLDEVGTLGPGVQVKLLEVLQDRTFHRVGGERPIEVDVRIVAATNIDLKQAVEDGTFRKDLFYRLDVFPIVLPPLRERSADIPRLVETFRRKFNELHGKAIREVQGDVMRALEEYDWPGNVRELESVMERAFIMERSDVLTPASFEELIARPVGSRALTLPPDETLAMARRRTVETFERTYLEEQLSRHGGRIGDTARSAGITVRQLHKLMTRHGLRKEDYKRKP